MSSSRRPPYDNTVCPICGATVQQVRAWAHCPLHRAIVCMDHCYNDCPFLEPHTPHCKYRDKEDGQAYKTKNHPLTSGPAAVRG